jgi:hypothetical protein
MGGRSGFIDLHVDVLLMGSQLFKQPPRGILSEREREREEKNMFREMVRER